MLYGSKGTQRMLRTDVCLHSVMTQITEPIRATFTYHVLAADFSE